MYIAIPEPFGGIMILAGIIVLTVVGVAIAITGVKRKSRNHKMVGLGLISAPWIILLLIALLSPGIDEWNPAIKSDTDVHGVWQGDGYSIQLNSDYTFVATFPNVGGNGTWRRDDWNLSLSETDSLFANLRFVEDSGELLLLPKPPSGASTDPGPITRRK